MPRNLAPKTLDETYNVKSYGAKGDNSTNDDAAIAAAIAAVPSTGGVVYFPPGTYVTNTPVVPKDHVTFRGAGSNVTTIRTTLSLSGHGIDAVDINNFTMEDMGLQGVGQGVGTGYGLRFRRTSSANTAYISLRDVYIRQFGMNGVDISNNIVSVFERVNCENNGTGFRFHGDSGVAGTSVSLISCYANTNTNTGFDIDNMAYTSLHACASEGQTTNYLLTNCQSVSLNACGSEVMKAGGVGFKVNGGFSVKLDGCWDLTNRGKAFWFTGSHTNGVIQNCMENTPGVGATASIQVDAGCQVMAFQNSFTTAQTLSGNAPQIFGPFGFAGTVFMGAASDAYMYRTAANNIATDGVWTQWTEPTSAEHCATKGYVDKRVQVKTRSAVYTNNTTTGGTFLTSDTLDVGVYSVEVVALAKCTTTTPTTNMSVGFTGTATWIMQAEAGTSVGAVTTTTASSNVASTTTERQIRFVGRVAVTVAGQLTAKMAISVATTAPGTTLREGTYMRITKE